MEQHGDDTGERTGADERDEKKTIGKELQPRGGFFEHEDCNARKIRCCSGDDRRWRGARRRSLTQFDGIESSLEDINAIAGGIDAIVDGINAIVDGIDAIVDGINAIVDGINAIADGIDAIVDGINAIVDGINAIADGIDAIVDGINAIVDGINAIADGIDAIAGGIDAIARGIDAVAAQRSEVQRVLLAIRDEDAGYRYADKKWTWIAAGHVRQHLDVLHERYGSHADFSRVGICARRDSPVAR